MRRALCAGNMASGGGGTAFRAGSLACGRGVPNQCVDSLVVEKRTASSSFLVKEGLLCL